MKCRICGKNVVDGEVCKECCNTPKEEFKIKRKYSIKYEIFRNIYLYAIFILAGGMTGKASGMIVCILGVILLLGFLLFWNKRMAKVTICKFNDKKIQFKSKFFSIDIKKEILYENLLCINKDQTFWQKRFDLGDIYIYAKKGNLITTGIQVKNVPNFKETYEKINKLIDEKKK